MGVSKEFETYVVERLALAGYSVRSRRMFGGVGIYLDELFSALISGDDSTLYFKVDDSNRADYERAGAKPFMPYKGRATVMSYYQVPGEIVEDSTELARWAAKAQAAAAAAPRKRRKGS